MLRVGGLFSCAMFWLSLTSSAHAFTDRVAADTLRNRVDALQSCFEAKLRTLPDIQPTGLTYHYVIDRLADPDVPWEHGAIDAVCDGDLFAPYRRAYDDMKRAHKLVWAMPGTWGLDSESRLINILTRRGPYGHVLGHSDITSQSLSAMEGVSPTPDVLNLIGRAAQAPDIYAWSTTSFHAHTELPLGVTTVSPQAVQTSLEGYIAQAAAFLEQFERDVHKGEDPSALFILGLVLHGVQDLAYHRGMTFAEHAGLAYYLGLNPDILPEPDFTRVFVEAEALTEKLLAHARHKVGEVTWVRLMHWRQPASFDMHALARQVVPGARDVSFSELTAYWRLSLQYRYGGKERQDELRAAAAGRWMPTEALEQVLARAHF